MKQSYRIILTTGNNLCKIYDHVSVSTKAIKLESTIFNRILDSLFYDCLKDIFLKISWAETWVYFNYYRWNSNDLYVEYFDND